MDKIDIYLASPYSHEDKQLLKRRFHLACRAAAALGKLGYTVFSPIAHGHPQAFYHGLPGTWEYWRKIDSAILGVSRCLIILKIKGWRESKGLAEEISLAAGYGLPVGSITPTGRSYTLNVPTDIMFANKINHGGTANDGIDQRDAP